MNQNDYHFLNILKAALAGEVYEPEGEIQTEAWEQILKLAQQHHVLPMVVETCHRTPGLAGTSVLDAVRKGVRQQVFLQARKTAGFLSLYGELRKAGLKPLVVKGIICRNLYPHPDQRFSSDEDVLIGPEQFDLCHRTLKSLGMETREPEETFGDRYEIPYTGMGGVLYIELHKSLFPRDDAAYGELNGYFENVFDSPAEETVEGVTILTMAPTDHLFYLICHAFKHFLHGGFGIRQVCDINLFARHYSHRIDWDRVHRCCESIRADRFGAAVFAIGSRYLGLTVELPEQWKTDVDELPMLEDLLASGIYGGADMERKHSSNITLHAVARQKQGKDTGGGVIRSLFPNLRSMEDRYPYLKKHPALLPVAWISRISGFALRRGSSGTAAKTVRLGNERIGLLKYYGILDN